MPHLLIGTPCYNGLVTTDYLVSLLALQTELTSQGIGFSLGMTASVSLIPVARNFLAGQVLNDPKITHLMFIDADIGFDPAAVTRLVQANRDLVAGIYPIKHLDMTAVRRLLPDQSVASTYNYAVAPCQGEQDTTDGFIQAEYAATGFMLIRRQVLEQMAQHHPELKYDHMFTHITAREKSDNEHLYALFDTSLDRENGLYLPEDYTFCRRWRAMGGEIWVDTLSKLTHIGSFQYQGDFSVFMTWKQP